MRGKKKEIPAEDGECEAYLWSIGQLAHFCETSERTIRRYCREGLERRKDGRFNARESIFQIHRKILTGDF
ncbi:MAG TPA: hypothetical protein DD706_24625 [Nitrospiraceae bacterium]|nr:hypothetical protein [Nitrospiraceae bacterium]